MTLQVEMLQIGNWTAISIGYCYIGDVELYISERCRGRFLDQMTVESPKIRLVPAMVRSSVVGFDSMMFA